MCCLLCRHGRRQPLLDSRTPAQAPKALSIAHNTIAISIEFIEERAKVLRRRHETEGLQASAKLLLGDSSIAILIPREEEVNHTSPLFSQLSSQARKHVFRVAAHGSSNKREGCSAAA